MIRIFAHSKPCRPLHHLYSLALYTILSLTCPPALATNLLVDVGWLNQQQGKNPDVLVIDVRDETLYAQGHINRAINIPVGLTFSDTKNGLRIASPLEIGNLFSRHGILKTHHIVLYDNGELKNAARFFWVLETYGHKQVSILNGGLSQWQQATLSLSTVAHKLTPSQYTPYIQHRNLATKLTTRLALNNKNIAIIDSRRSDEFQGYTSGMSRHGHIPSAINVPWNQNLIENNNVFQLKPQADLEAIYKFVKRSDSVIAYCTRGKESAVSYFVLRLLGYKVSLYDGAWVEWSSDLNLPVHPTVQ